MKSRKIGIITATEFELSPFLQNMTVIETVPKALLQFHEGKYAEVPVVAVFCGICKVNVAIGAQVLISEFDVTEIIMIGVAGAIDETLSILDTVIADQITYHDYAGEILTKFHPRLQQPYFITDDLLRGRIAIANADDLTVSIGKMVTGEVFIEKEGREEIIKNHHPKCVDMETASVAQVCYASGIPFAAIRSMSDTPHESGMDAFFKYAQAAAEKSVRVLCRYLDTEFFMMKQNQTCRG
jgi:adenosylhomocysteine nucleosidase